MNVLGQNMLLKFDKNYPNNYRILSLKDELRIRMLAIALISVVVEARLLIIYNSNSDYVEVQIFETRIWSR